MDSSREIIDRAAEWIRTYDAQGIHRSTLAADEQSAQWLADETVEIGGQMRTDEFPFERVDPIATYAEVDGTRIAGEPLFDSPFSIHQC
jgi:hypothetical protein